METELKFQIPPPQRQALARAVHTPRAQRTRLRAVYADTADQRLAAAGLALRLRQEGACFVQTLKGRGDGLVQRLEHECPLPADSGLPTLDPERHAGSAAGLALQAALAGAGPLVPVYETDVWRVHRRVRFEGAWIEIAHDCGQIRAGARTAEVDEIEFELLSGPAHALVALAQRWVRRFGLWWDVRSKSERGWRLAFAFDQIPADPTRATTLSLPPAATTADVWQAALRSALLQALPNAAVLADGHGGPDHVHQLRVSLRRLRSALRVLAPWSPNPDAALALEQTWQAPFAALGAARDAEVLRMGWQTLLQQMQAPPLDWPRGDWAAAVGATVRGSDFTLALLQTLQLALPPQAAPTDVDAARSGAVAALLRPLWRQMRRDAAAFATAPEAEQHRTRRRLKRLRYVLEFVQPLGRPQPAALPPWRRLHERACVALEALGELNDLYGAQAWFEQLAQQQPGAWFAVGVAASRRPRALRRAVAALARLRRA